MSDADRMPDDAPAYVSRARTLIAEQQVTEAASVLLGGLKQQGDCVEARVLLEEIFSGQTTSHLLNKQELGSVRQAPESKPADGAATDGLHLLEMTAEAAEEHEWWIYWCSFVGSSLLGVLLLAGAFCHVAVSPALANSALPLSGFAAFVVTMIVCCRIHERHKRYQPGVFIPVISELGIQQPGTLIYQVGFVLVGILLAGSMYRYETTVVPLLLSKGCMPMSPAEEEIAGISRAKFVADLSTAVRAGYGSAFGAGLQGFYTLELQASLKVMLHFVGAMIFMWGGMTHAQAIEPIYAAGASLECTLLAQPPVSMAATFRRVSITGVLPVIGFVLPLGFQLVQFVYGDGSSAAKKSVEVTSQPNEQATKKTSLSSDAKSKGANQDGEEETPPTHNSAGMSNGMGALQWAIVILFATFYASYAPDLYFAAPPLVEDAEGSGAVQPVAILVCSILGLATGLAFYFTEYMMDS